MVQYAALVWASRAPELVRYTDNIRILESLAATGLMAAEQVGALIDVYQRYRSAGHRLVLQGLPVSLASDQFVEERRVVSQAWQALLEAE